MSKNNLILFWVFWLLDVLAALYGHREFLMGLFGRYAAPTPYYILLWVLLLSLMLAILAGSVYLKNQGNPTAALVVAGAPLALALPYLLWVAMVVIARPDWR